MHPRHFGNYNFTHKHTLALKIGTDKVFDATNPKMKSDLQKNEDFNEILAKNEIFRMPQWRSQKGPEK